MKKSDLISAEGNEVLKEILEVEKLSGLLEQFYNATGLANFIVDLKGNILHGVGWKSICTEFHRKHQTSSERCLISDTILANRLNNNEKYAIYICQNGMVDVAIPIIIEGVHVANFFIGQFFFETPDKDFFVNQAEELGFDKEKYIKALNECHVYNKDTILRFLDFFGGLINMISESALKTIKNKKQVAEITNKDKWAEELIIADKKLSFQNEEKADRAADLVIADKELAFQNEEKADRAAELVIANKELAFQNEEKADRAAELVIANKELAFQNEEKADRAAELIIANKELAFQNEEKDKRAAELIIANKELAFQNEEKADRAAELVIANKELAFQNEEKADRAAELIIANKELAIQNEEKDKRAAELIVANKELAFQNKKITYLNHHDFLTDLYNRIYFEDGKKRLDTAENLPISIIMGDINGLKLINDGFGHSMGDKVLIEIAKILKSCCREGDVVSRIGGDEFGILLPKEDSESVQLICSRISDACKGYAVNGGQIYPSISVGYATKNIVTEKLDNILMTAEELMFRQKLLESKSAHSSIIASLKVIMFERSQETEEHAERLVQLSKSLGQALSLTDDQLNELSLLSTLHDIGKMSVAADILSKPGKLNDEEWIEMRKHPEIGFRIAQATSELVPIAKYILCHHERWDGKGYPQGLAGEKIPLLSRILSIVDAFDAMTNDRAYRSAMTKEDAMEEIKKNSGTQFDPDISRLFLNIINTPD
jgi:diguanylate cyclase (GGDEF)-like protein